MRSIRPRRATGHRVKTCAPNSFATSDSTSPRTRSPGHYELDGRAFVETVTFDGVKSLEAPAVVALAQLWYLVAGLSYYKAGAARRIDVGHDAARDPGPAPARGRALHDGLGRVRLPQSDPARVTSRSRVETRRRVVRAVRRRESRVLTPFGGGIDSVVTIEKLRDQVDQSLFIVSPATGRFAPLEATAAVTGLDVVRASRTLDPQIVRGDEHSSTDTCRSRRW